MSTKDLGGKLELLFAYLSINNVRHIQPLLLGAIDEYQTMREKMSYDEKKDVNLIKSLLWHAERGEWSEARNHLNGAQKAYQEYISRSTVDDKTVKVPGYTEIHGTQNSYTNIYKNAKKDPNDYMFRNSQFDPFEPRLKVQTSDRWTYSTNPRLSANRAWSARSSRRTVEDQVPVPLKPRKSSVDEIKEPAPSEIDTGYPGKYAVPAETKPETLKEAIETLKIDTARSNRDESEKVTKISSRQPSNDVTPRVADGDENRPTKIADAFTAIYNCQWKQAFDKLKQTGLREEKVIEYLIRILKECYKLCSEESQSQVLEFEKAALNILTNGKYSEDEKARIEKKGDVKLMIKYRKEVADLSVKRFQDIFLTKTLPVLNRRHDIQETELTDEFARECIAVSWRMVIQDPPLHLVEAEDIDKVYFDSRLYKPFTKSGGRVKYFVWPILQVNKGGPILARGIAQGE